MNTILVLSLSVCVFVFVWVFSYPSPVKGLAFCENNNAKIFLMTERNSVCAILLNDSLCFCRFSHYIRQVNALWRAQRRTQSVLKLDYGFEKPI